MQKQITWKPMEVDVRKIKSTPNNYKIKTDLGKERLQHSLKLFGLAGTVVCNTDLTLIDGNSRLEQAKERGERKIWVSVPNRKLTPKEFHEMSAMYDFAKAGEVDMERIEQDLGKTEEFFHKWNLEVPIHLLESMGKAAERNGKLPALKKKGKEDKVAVDTGIRQIQIFLTEKQEKQFRVWEEKLAKKWKTDNTSDTVFQAIKVAAK